MLKIFDIMENLNFEKEVWCDIPNYEGYQVSNLGRVKSLERFDALGHKRKEKLLKLWVTRNGYYQVCLYKNSIGKFYKVHRLVWIAFNGTIPEGYEINHLDERPVNNALSNLSLVTCKENINYGTGNERRAKKITNRKDLSKVVLQFDLNDNFIKEYPSTMQVERELGFDCGHISNCCNGKIKIAYGFIWRYKE